VTSTARILLFAPLFACAHGAPAPEPVRAYAEVNGLHMYYEVHGQGRPVLLLHGGTGAGPEDVPRRLRKAFT
jgi:hypothetical protein